MGAHNGLSVSDTNVRSGAVTSEIQAHFPATGDGRLSLKLPHLGFPIVIFLYNFHVLAPTTTSLLSWRH
jgi:hypothetical protein